jgi:hypothetical protein
MCTLWCHKECAKISEEFFKSLELQKKEMGIAWWGCRSCVSFATKMNARFKEVDKRMDLLTERVDENTGELEQVKEKVDKVEKRVEEAGRRMENSERKSEDGMLEELRAREAIRRNVVLYGVEEPDRNIRTDKERIEADISECEKIFKATKANVNRKDIRFCRRIGEKGQGKRPMLVGMTSEQVKVEILDSARELQYTAYKDISIGPDQTKKQRHAEKKLAEEAERKNREELTEQDEAKNLKWMVVGRKGEKRIVKGTAREETWGPGPSSRQQGARGRGRGGVRSTARRTNNEEMDLDDGSQKRGRGGTGNRSESEEEENDEPPRTRPRQ